MTEKKTDLDSLLREHGWLTRLAAALVGAGEVDDLVQETYRAVLEGGLPRTSERGRVRGWLRVIATRRAAERWREQFARRGHEANRVRDAASASDERGPVPGAELERAELRGFLAGAVLALDAPLRDAAVLRYFEERSYAQVAAQLDITQALARSRVSRACAALRERLDRRSGGDRSLWLSVLVPVLSRTPKGSARPMVASGTVAAVLMTMWWQRPAPAVDALDPVAPLSVPAANELAALPSPLPDRVQPREAERVSPTSRQEPAGTGPPARAAFPLPPAHERATLDVLAIWDDTEEVVPGVLLAAFGRAWARTDLTGRVRFAGLPPGHGRLSSLRGTGLNLKLEPGETRAVTLRIGAEFSVHGCVVDAGGKIVPDAQILVGTTSNGWSFPLTQSDARGAFTLEGLSGYVYLAASHEDHGVSLAKRVTEERRAGEEILLVVAGGCGALAGSGQVIRRSNRPGQAVFGEGLQLAGLDPGALYLLEAEDVEGRSGSTQVVGGQPAQVRMR